jgi:hypothetical protein
MPPGPDWASALPKASHVPGTERPPDNTAAATTFFRVRVVSTALSFRCYQVFNAESSRNFCVFAWLPIPKGVGVGLPFSLRRKLKSAS